MFRNYLVTALRNIARHKLHSFIKITGLAVGMACVILVLLFVSDELSYDKWLPGAHHLYRVEKIARPPGHAPLEMATGPYPLVATMRDNIPEVTAATHLTLMSMSLFAGGRAFRERVLEVEPNFLTVVQLPLLRGDPATVFRDPESVVISQAAAQKYFGTTDAIGKFFRTTANCKNSDPVCRAQLVPLKVTGILRDIPHNSQLEGDVLIPDTSIVDRLGQDAKRQWFSNPSFGYVRLAPGAKAQTVAAKMAPLFDRFIPRAQIDNQKGSLRYAIHLTPFTDVHLDGGRWHGNEKPSGSRATLVGVSIVGMLILFVACFNFTNLATAQASLRAREIALRKIVGAKRRQLAFQFLGEAVVTALLSLVLALALVEVLRPAFGRLLGVVVTLPYDAASLASLGTIAILAGLLSGIYPALVLSGFRPSAILRGDIHGGSGRLQAFLVVLQFAVSIGLGIAVIVVFSQINFVRAIDLGFRRDNVVAVAGIGLLSIGGQEGFIQRLKSDPDIVDVAMIDTPPFNGSYTLASGRLAGHAEPVSLYRRVFGANTAQFLGMRLVAGRLLSDRRAQDAYDTTDPAPKGANDGHNILIDMAAASNLGLTPQQAVGQTLIIGKEHLQIVGVLSAIKLDGAREAARAAFYVYDPHQPAVALVGIRRGATPRALTFIDRAWRDFAPTKAVERWFLEDDFQRLYRADERLGTLFSVFVGIAIFISCLGLFGLAAFTAGRRTREIGIRKVFGARTRDLVVLLLWQFSIPVLVANLIAWPVAWYWLHSWLQGFAYRIALSPIYFASAGAGALLIAWATILGHALHVARANPIHALRTE